MTDSEAYSDLSSALFTMYEKREAENIADWVMENITGKKRWQRRTDTTPLTVDELNLFDRFKRELLTGKPVQYVLNEAFFCGYRFTLNDNVLIPRPETEELVQLVIDENQHRKNIVVLDIGTGSGCIPISIKKKMQDAVVTSIDVSRDAILTARENAINLGADVDFRLLDFLNESNWGQLGRYDVIVSNPPYIPETEKSQLSRNVIDFEPSAALFVPGNAPLLFYKKIQHFCSRHMNQHGKVYLEVNEKYAGDVLDIFTKQGWSGKIINDIYGKERMVVAGL